MLSPEASHNFFETGMEHLMSWQHIKYLIPLVSGLRGADISILVSFSTVMQRGMPKLQGDNDHMHSQDRLWIS